MFSQKFRILAGIALLLSIAFILSAADSAPSTEAEALPPKGPLGEIQSTIDELIKVVEALPGEDKRQTRRTQMREVISKRFDFREMSQLSLGSNWTALKEAERTEFTSVFSDLLAKTYLNRIENIQKGMVKLNSERIIGRKAAVKTTVKYKEDIFPLDYKLLVRDGQWKVYDVIIENIGLVANYRNEFAGIIRKDGFPMLIERLKNKLAGKEE